jgi:O-succinylbenzoate synthase
MAVAAISQALTPDGGDADKIRVAMNHALVEALDGVEVFNPESITDDVIVDTMICYLAESIFLQIVMDSNKAWNKAEFTTQAVTAENDLRELIKVVVDQHMAPKLAGQVRSLSSSDFVQVEKQVIAEVWTEWEKFQ